MAFVKEPSFIKRSILAFIKHMVSKQVFRAIDIILHPCCGLTITGITFSCTATGVATATVTIDPFTFPDTFEAVLTSDDSTKPLVAILVTAPGSTSLVFEGVHLTNSAANVTYTLQLLFPTTTVEAKGVYIAAEFTVNNPSCT